MNDFKDFGIKPDYKSVFVGDKIKIIKIIDKQITVLAFRIEDSKFKKENNNKCLYLQIEYQEEKRVVFVASKVLIDMIQRVGDEKFPFKTRIIQKNGCYEFS